MIAWALLSCALAGCAEAPYSALDAKAPEWQLVFSDEFDGKGRPDRRKWKSKEYNRNPSPDGPDGWWEADNAFLDGEGHLVLRTSVIKNRNWLEDDDEYDYASAMVTTEGRFEQAFGRYEARVQLPETPGWWAAFWLFSDSVHNEDGSGRDGTEIDIAEFFGWTDRVHNALHWDGYGRAHQATSTDTITPGIRKGWHTFALEWYPDEYVFFVDGKETWRTSAGGVCQTPLRVKLSSEVATVRTTTNEWWANKPDPSQFPDDVVFDWVRVYERVPEPEPAKPDS
ncbi:MAG: glycoside hydrolase family 16 protein [Hyphomonas sp.]|nr:glycoside hydrolase family 16 protein [Hyphomonas sp.]